MSFAGAFGKCSATRIFAWASLRAVVELRPRELAAGDPAGRVRRLLVPRVVLSSRDREAALVALRGHLASPPSVERITTTISTKPALKWRLKQEERLKRLEKATIDGYPEPNVEPVVMRCAPRPRQRSRIREGPRRRSTSATTWTRLRARRPGAAQPERDAQAVHLELVGSGARAARGARC